MNLRKIFIGFITVLCLLASACLSVMFLFEYGMYLPGQYINGVDVGLLTEDTALEKVLSQRVSSIEVTRLGNTETMDNVIRFDYVESDLKQSLLNWLNRTPIELSIVDVVNIDKVREMLSSVLEPCSDASLLIDDNKVVLIPEVVGYDFNIEAALLQASSGSIDLDSLRKFPTVTKESLQDTYDRLEWINDYAVSYACGITLSRDDLFNGVSVDSGEIETPVDYFNEVLKELQMIYNTDEGSVEIPNPHGEGTLTVQKKTFGRKVNTEKELKALVDSYEKHESLKDREPVMSGYDTLDGTYIVVSIEDQHLWYYKDGELYSETDVVTGRKGVHDTPTGAYYISECIPGKDLKGEGYVTWVNQWMRLTNSGIGLHDAYWRSSFGKDIYKSNGSHGCINLPKGYAKELYSDAYVGMPVFIY